MSAILDFYRGGRDVRGRSLDQVLAWDDALLEMVHDYIQWLFPLPERSAFNADAPLLTSEDIAAFRNDPALRDRLRAAYHRMLRFYALPTDTAETFAAQWLTPGNHNFLRITRILRCLRLLGLEAEARDFLNHLEALYTAGAGRIIGSRTLEYWRRA